MKEMPSYGLKVRHPLRYLFGVLTGITICVYLVFRYLLHLFLPFILAYLLMRMLFPVIWFLRHHCHFPKWLADGGTLTVFFGAVFGTVLAVIRQLLRQIRLFGQNFPVYRREFMALYVHHTGRLCGCLDTWLGLPAGKSRSCISSWCDRLLAESGSRLSEQAGFFRDSEIAYGGVDHCCEYDRIVR